MSARVNVRAVQRPATSATRAESAVSAVSAVSVESAPVVSNAPPRSSRQHARARGRRTARLQLLARSRSSKVGFADQSRARDHDAFGRRALERRHRGHPRHHTSHRDQAGRGRVSQAPRHLAKRARRTVRAIIPGDNLAELTGEPPRMGRNTCVISRHFLMLFSDRPVHASNICPWRPRIL